MFAPETYTPRRHWAWIVVAVALALFVLFVVAVPKTDEEPVAARSTAERAIPQAGAVRARATPTRAAAYETPLTATPTVRATPRAAATAEAVERPWWQRLPWDLPNPPRTEGIACALVAELQEHDQAGTNADLDRVFGREGRNAIIWRCATEVDW